MAVVDTEGDQNQSGRPRFRLRNNGTASILSCEMAVPLAFSAAVSRLSLTQNTTSSAIKFVLPPLGKQDILKVLKSTYQTISIQRTTSLRAKSRSPYFVKRLAAFLR